MEMIVSREKITKRPEQDDAIVVATPLDAITQLESGPIARVVLAGAFATDPVFGAFIEESYPEVEVQRDA
jgi:hypothetical protein